MVRLSPLPRLGISSAVDAEDLLQGRACGGGYTQAYVEAIPDSRLLEMILRHKWLEFFTENSEEWFDLVRFHAWDNYPIAPYYVKSDRHLILPIPRKALGGNRALKQNPGY